MANFKLWIKNLREFDKFLIFLFKMIKKWIVYIIGIILVIISFVEEQQSKKEPVKSAIDSTKITKVFTDSLLIDTIEMQPASFPNTNSRRIRVRRPIVDTIEQLQMIEDCDYDTDTIIVDTL